MRRGLETPSADPPETRLGPRARFKTLRSGAPPYRKARGVPRPGTAGSGGAARSLACVEHPLLVSVVGKAEKEVESSTRTGHAADAVPPITSGIAAWRSMGGTVFSPWWLSCLATAYAELSRYDDAWLCIGELMTLVETTKERWCEAEVYRLAGEIALLSSERDAAKAEGCFRHACLVARQQQAKSWELRAAMSSARLWRDQRKVQEARDCLLRFTGGLRGGSLKGSIREI